MPPFDKPKLRVAPEPTAIEREREDQDGDDGNDEVVTISHWADPDLLLFRTFRGHVKTIATNETTGELSMKIGIAPDDRFDAFALTDFTGYVFTFDTYIKPRRARQDADEDSEAAPCDENEGEGG